MSLRFEVLIATMYQKDYKLLETMKIESDAVVINQCDHESEERFIYQGHRIVWINTEERGLSKSRNMAIKYSTADICLICDEDEILKNGYMEIIIGAYQKTIQADIIVFNINRIGWNEEEKKFPNISKVPKWKTYSSVHLTFKRNSIIKSNIKFDVDFGAGSKKYLCAEDALFCRSCHSNKLHMYTFPAVIADVYCDSSSWFEGYNEHYFYDTGAFLAAAYPKTKNFLKWYYPLRCKKISNLSSRRIIKSINKGICGYKEKLSYDEYSTNY